MFMAHTYLKTSTNLEDLFFFRCVSRNGACKRDERNEMMKIKYFEKTQKIYQFGNAKITSAFHTPREMR